MARKASLRYDFNWYTPSNLKAMLEGSQDLNREVRKEYSKLRDIARKRLQRLEAAGYTETEAYRRNVNHYPKLKDIKTKSELAQRLSDLSRFIASSQSTVSGIKEREQKVLEKLHENQYNFVNESNLKDFGEFMEAYRDQMLDMEYDSGDAAEVYSIIVKHKVDPEKVKEDFEYWLEHIDEALKMRRSKASAGNYERIKKRLDKKLKKGNKRK